MIPAPHQISNISTMSFECDWRWDWGFSWRKM